MIHRHLFVGLGLILLVTGGCQTAQAPREKDKQANAYLEQAQAYESQGNLVEALEQYKLAKTTEPDQPVITERIQRLEEELRKQAGIHYHAGLRFRDKGKWQLAKKEFLKALRYWPEHEKAAAMLQQRQPEVTRKYVVHRIGPGESISKVALKYYGDYKKYHHIANFNNMTDATRVRVGQRIMVPVIDGVSLDDLNRINTAAEPAALPTVAEGEYTLHKIKPGQSLSKIAKIYYGDFTLYKMIAAYNGIDNPTSVKVGQTIKVPRLDKTGTAPEAGTPHPPETEETPEAVESKPQFNTPDPVVDVPDPEPLEPVDQVADHRQAGIDLFNQQKYDESIVELQKVLGASPDDGPAIRYISRAHIELGKEHLAAGRLEEARSALQTALDHDANCHECRDLLSKTQNSETDSLRIEGETYLRSNQFDKAINTLERVIALNPDDEAAVDLLFQTHYQKGLIRYDKKDYLAARDAFGNAKAVKPDCADCQQYIDDSTSEYLEMHYNEGIVFFGKEKLKKAIIAWEKVSAVDPDYKDVRQNLKKATLLNDRLERIKKSSKE
ncbi:MAG: hypothetical protein CSA23_06230 [Deltaproteobacteria bacterium]|nr:MAG: hypothetical protein CSA23_06230 [Deltaproteobacteria bacterium]